MYRPIILLALVSLWLVSAYEHDTDELLEANARAIRSDHRYPHYRHEHNGYENNRHGYNRPFHAHGHYRPFYAHGHHRGPFNDHRIASNLCANTSIAESFIVQTEALITIFSNNNSYTAVTNKHANEFAFIQDPANQAIIVSNCTGFFSGLNAARALDTAAVQQVELFTRDAETQLSNIVRTLSRRKHHNHRGHRRPFH